MFVNTAPHGFLRVEVDGSRILMYNRNNDFAKGELW